MKGSLPIFRKRRFIRSSTSFCPSPRILKISADSEETEPTARELKKTASNPTGAEEEIYEEVVVAEEIIEPEFKGAKAASEDVATFEANNGRETAAAAFSEKDEKIKQFEIPTVQLPEGVKVYWDKAQDFVKRVQLRVSELVDSVEEDSTLGVLLQNLKQGQFTDFFWFFTQAGFILGVLFFPAVWPAGETLLAFAAGPALIIIGVVLIVSGLTSLGLVNLTPFPTPVPNNKLVTTGAYSMVRHPMYSGLLFVLLGVSFATMSPLRLILSAVFFRFIDSKASKEEALLADRHPEYPRYRSKVKKLVPFVY